jgi:glyoxylase-like metal-dependent hydrolase (beta-lactamase superfamily II)
MSGDWTDPGPHAVAPGVHRIPCPLPGDGLQAVNVYAIADGEGIALVDTGWGHEDCLAALERGLHALGAALADVRTVLCTHAHYDHYGLAAHIRRAAGAEVALGRIELELVRVAAEQPLYERWVSYRRDYLSPHGASEVLAEIERSDRLRLESVGGRGLWETPDRLLEDGEEIVVGTRTLQARLTPGHTRGHLMLLDAENGLLFAGDHVLPHITPSLGFEPFTDGRALHSFLQSLKDTRELRPDLVLPGHGPVFGDLAGRVDELLDHHRQRLADCVTILEQRGPDSALAVAQRLRWTRHGRAFHDLDVFNRLLAVTETVTHLELLADEGRLQRDGAATVLYARAA